MTYKHNELINAKDWGHHKKLSIFNLSALINWKYLDYTDMNMEPDVLVKEYFDPLSR